MLVAVRDWPTWEASLAIYRMYTGADGHTRIEETPLAAHPDLTQLEAVKGIYLRTRPDEHMEPHPAPEHRWLVVLSGFMEVAPANGKGGVRLGPGDIVRISDVSGSGHSTTFIGNCVFAVMPIAAGGA